MRKVFVSIMLLGTLNSTQYISEDFVVGEKQFNFPISYLISNEVKFGDEVEIITAVEHGEGNVHTAVKNYHIFVKEVQDILAERDVKLHFTEVEINKKFEDNTFTRFFRNISELLHDNDVIYADFTFGMKAYSLSMFIALAYAVRAAKNAELCSLLYSQKYTGTDDATEKNTSELCDITSLFYLNDIAGNAYAGQKEGLDEIMRMIIRD